MSSWGRRAFEDALQDIRRNSCSQVDLGLRDLDSEKAKELAVALEGNSSVTTLHLSYNRLGNEGVTALAQVLRGSLVQTLHLVNNYIGDEGARALASALRNGHLTELWLFKNDIGPEGAAALAASLPDSEITQLLFSSNRIGEEGGRALLEAVSSSALSELDLSDNSCSGELLGQIKAVLEAQKAASFILQMQVEGAEPAWRLTFRTLAGTVAAALDWSCDRDVAELPGAVFASMRTSGFKLPKYLKVQHLRIVRPDGKMLEISEAASLAQQLAGQ